MRTVTLIDYPLQIGLRARQHRESLLREFAIIASGGGDDADIPKRLLEISRLHDDRYAGLNPDADAAVDAGIARGEEFIDVAVSVPERIGPDTLEVARLLLEVDAYCQSGDLLTLAPAPELRAFWVWLLREIVRQVNGEPPESWRAFTMPEWLG